MPKELPRKKLLIFGSLVLVLLLAFLVSLTQQKKTLTEKMTVDEIGNVEQPVTDLGRPDLPVVQAPAMTFSNYQTDGSTVALPSDIKVYTFRSEYSPAYVSVVGQKLGLDKNQLENNTLLLYNDTEDLKSGYLKFNLKNGNYEFSSYGTHVLPQTGSLTENVKLFLIDLGLADETVTCNITYKRTDVTGTNFVECHRDWQKTGLPILNFAGLLNIPQLSSVKSLQVGMVDDNAVDDPNIINVSTGQNGKVRPDDYNTVTVAVAENGDILKINSNLRMIEASIDFTQTDLLTPEEAVERFRNNQAPLSLIQPVDENVAWETVFPGNTAENLDARITDFMLVYIENPFGGKSLTPMYLARGTAETAGGYDVVFLQAVPALKGQQTLSGEVAGLMAQQQPNPTQFYDESLKLGTFNPDQRSVQYTPDSASPCVPSEEQLSPIIELGEYGRVGLFTLNIPTETPGKNLVRPNQWYLIPTSSNMLPQIDSVISSFKTLNLEEKHADDIRELDELQKQWEKYNFCPLRLTGSSPSLFVYGKDGQKYEISVGKPVIYAKPEQENGVWKTKNNSIIYYEYQTVSFTKPQQGWNVRKTDLNQFARSLGHRLGLTGAETDKLNFELNLAAGEVKNTNLFIGPISQTEVDMNLPLKVSPEVKTLRYHFYVTQVANTDPAAPELTPVTRTNQMVLELGAVAR